MASRSVVGRYAALFRVEGVPSLVAAMVVARMPTGCVSLLLVLFVSSVHGAAIAGAASAAWTIGMALVAPFLGRLVDRGRGPSTLCWSAMAEALAVVALILAVTFVLPALVVVGMAFFCGALTPPVAGTTRSLWKVTVPEDLLPVAYSFEILLIDVLYVSGPLLASVFVVLGAPAWGIGLTTGLLVIGSVALAFSQPVKRYALLGRSSCAQRTSAKNVSLFRDPAIGATLVACMGAMAFSGWLETLLPLYYSAQGLTLESGVAISVWSAGSIAGVLAFVRLQPSKKRAPLDVQLVVCTLLYAFACALLSFQNGFLGMCLILLGIGLLVSPCTNLHYQLGGDLAPSSRQAEMFSWLNTATSAGISVGALLSGITIEHQGFQAAFQMPVAFVVVALASSVGLMLLMRHRRASLRAHEEGVASMREGEADDAKAAEMETAC